MIVKNRKSLTAAERVSRGFAPVRSDVKYALWLSRRNGLSFNDALRQARSEKIADPAPPAATQREKTTARENDKGADMRRWERVWRGCDRRGCLLSLGHSGPHDYGSHSYSDDGQDSLNERSGE